MRRGLELLRDEEYIVVFRVGDNRDEEDEDELVSGSRGCRGVGVGTGVLNISGTLGWSSSAGGYESGVGRGKRVTKQVYEDLAEVLGSPLGKILYEVAKLRMAARVIPEVKRWGKLQLFI